MPQPPVIPVFSREVGRSAPFIVPRTFRGALGSPGNVYAEFDTLDGFSERTLYNNTLAFPGVDTPKLHAVGPWLDAAAYVSGDSLIRVEYSIDRGCAYRQAFADTPILAGSFGNLSGLRITARFVKVTLINNAGVAIDVEFGVYVRSQ